MTYLDLGVTAVKRAAWSESNPTALIKRAIEENPGKSDAEHYRAFCKLLGEQPNADALIEVILHYYFDLNKNRLTPRLPTPTKTKAERDEAAKRGAATVIAKILLGDVMMPGLNKKLRDCTGAECVEIGPKLGMWVVAIGRKIGPSAIVGKTLSEAQMLEIWNARKSAP